MKSLVRWAITNSPAMNTWVLAVLIIGGACLATMRREVYPEFALEIIVISVEYPGATPSEVEEGICQKLEEAVRSISGIKKLDGVARDGAGFLVLELESNVRDVAKVIAEVRAEIDRIPSLPELAEDPRVEQMTLRTPAIRVGVIGPAQSNPDAELMLREVAERVREDLLQLPSVSQANLVNVKDYQIDIEIPEETLRKYGLSLQEIAQLVRRENIELPSGKLSTHNQEILLRGKNRRVTGEEIARIPLVTSPDGVVLTVGDLGTVRDAFEDATAANWINGRPGMVISIDRTASEDLLKITGEVQEYVAREAASFPPGYELVSWQDTSVDVRDRIRLLTSNGLQGLMLVFLTLAVFQELKLAFWVAAGIPISLFGAAIVLTAADQTLNMISMFGFLLTLGIVVDDGIVIGESIFARRRAGESLAEASVNGTWEVIGSVIGSVATTVAAFLPLFFVAGILGKFIAVLPLSVVSMLLVSLLESCFVLPCHLAHRENLLFRLLGIALYPFRPFVGLFAWLNRHALGSTDWFIDRCYKPVLAWSLNYPGILFSLAIALLFVTAGMVRSGVTPWVLFPKLDSTQIEAEIIFPDGMPAEVTDLATRQLESALAEVNRRFANPVVRVTHRALGQITQDSVLGAGAETKGSQFGGVYAELCDPAARDVTSDQILRDWRVVAGTFQGAERLTYSSSAVAPAGNPIEFRLLAPSQHHAALEAASEQCQRKLSEYAAVFDIRDDLMPGKWEYRFRIDDAALALGVTAADLAETVRASFHGDEVMRLQRGRHEVKLMVRYPTEERRSWADLEDIRIRGQDGIERPLTELASMEVERGYSEIFRADQLRAVTITADVDETKGNAFEIVRDLQETFMPTLQQRFPDVRVRWEGQEARMEESVNSIVTGMLLAVFGIFCLLTLQFRSYFQPFIILAIIPLAFIGAIWGHALMGLPITIFSLFGLVALTGVVVNDSIVLVDYINQRVGSQVPLRQAVLEAGPRRFLPVMLTSVTTIAGLMPMLLETSYQAQALIPMAVSLSFGLLASTMVVLLITPALYLVVCRRLGVAHRGDAEIEADPVDSSQAELVTRGNGAASPGAN